MVSDPTAEYCQCADVTFEYKCPSDIHKQPDEGKTTARVSWTDPTEPGADVECQPASGSLFEEGTTLITCTANYVDPSINTSSCVFKVHIGEKSLL